MAEAQKARGFWTKARVLIAIILVAGIIIGGLIEHYAIEPLLNSKLLKSLSECTVQKNLLESQAGSLISELNACKNK